MSNWEIDHVQLAIPAGSEERCDAFYVTLLGFEVLAKPPRLASRGGRWYQRGLVSLHLGVDPDFQPARKAHVALGVADYGALVVRLAEAHYPVQPDDAVAGVTRCYVADPCGNRLELIDLTSGH